jgi:conjugal transfer pilus assembly protein TraF
MTLRYLKIVFYRFLLPILAISITASSLASARNTELQGYNWYNEKPEEAKKAQEIVNTKQAESVTNPEEPDLPGYEKNIRSLQDRHEKAHRQALDNPTAENILTELRLEKEMLNKSQLYGERRVAVAILDSQFTDMKAHSNILHKKVQEEIEAKDMFKKLSNLSTEWGLILQVAEDCPHCHAFAPIVLEFAQKHNFELLAANKGGDDFGNIEGVSDNGEMLIFNPTRATPMLYLVKSDGKVVLPISRGIHSEDQIIINIQNIDKHIMRLF